MTVEALIRFGDELTIEALFAPARFIPSDQKNGPPHRIKSERHSPDTISGLKSKLLHICVTRALQCVDSRPSQLRPQSLNKADKRQQFVLNVLVQNPELGHEILMQIDKPFH